MITSTYLRAGSLAVHIWQPSFSGGTWTPRGRWLSAVTERIASYQHELRAHGGMWEASMTFATDLAAAEDWLDSGLVRHVECYDDAGCLLFEGFVNEVRVNVGGYSITRGPVTDLANRAALVFSALDTTVSPPRAGPRARTGVNNNTASQERYGIHYKIMSGGSILADDSLQLRDAYLAEASYVTTDRKLALGGKETPTVSLVIPGYVRMLEYPYNNGLTGTTTITAKVGLVLASEPNGLFSGVTHEIATNNTLVAAAESDDRTGWAIITECCSYGDTSYNRYVAAVGAGRSVSYGAIPTAIAYQYALRDSRQQITTPAGAAVAPWAVQAGQWLFLGDFMVGRVPPGTPLRNDPRMLYIESLTYEAPHGLTMTGGQADTISQRIARFGLASIGSV